MTRHSFEFAPRSILCAVDFSAQSGIALRRAAAMAKRSQGRITVLFVEDPRLFTGEAAANDPRTLRKLRSFVRRSLPRGTSTSIRCLVARGKPALEITRTAERLRSELVVVGTDGLGATRTVLFGSTTEQLLRKVHVPLLVVPKSSRWQGAKASARDWAGKWVIAPNDLESTATAEAAQAGGVARALGASLMLVHVMPTLHRPSWSADDLGTHYRMGIVLARKWLDELRLAVGDGVITKCHVAVGNPADEIAALAAERPNGLVVLTLRGRGGLRGSGAGLIAHHLLSHGIAPVLSLPPQGVPVHRRVAA